MFNTGVPDFQIPLKNREQLQALCQEAEFWEVLNTQGLAMIMGICERWNKGEEGPYEETYFSSAKDYIDSLDSSGWSVLDSAAQAGPTIPENKGKVISVKRIEIVRVLLESGADPSLYDRRFLHRQQSTSQELLAQTACDVTLFLRHPPEEDEGACPATSAYNTLG